MTDQHVGYNPRILFIASCIALIATAMSFAIRGDIMADFESEYVRPYLGAVVSGAEAVPAPVDAAETEVKASLGLIAGAAFWSFGLAILFGGPLCDLLGMGNLLRMAALCHIGGALLTIFAPSYWVVVVATFVVGMGNGLVEAVCNPLIATIYPNQKVRKLTLFHAWFPGGIVIGGVLAFLLSWIGLGTGSEYGWQIKMALLLIPAVVYTVMILGQKFPPTEHKASGLPFGDMFREALRRPLFILLIFLMILTAATELGTGAWIANIYGDLMPDTAAAGVLLLVWGSGIMYGLRQFAGGTAERISPVALIALTAPLAVIGLLICDRASQPWQWFVGSGILYVGFCFWWPTMLGITSERFPRTGALGLAIIGAVGSFSTAVSGWLMGKINDVFGTDRVLEIWAILPAIIFLAFGAIYLYDKSKGGYKVEVLEAAGEMRH